MPVDINRLTEGWLELESDPGLFTLLLENFGVKGVQVEEIYDLQKTLEGPVYGFIFLFRWIEERRSRRKIVHQTEMFVKDEEVINNIFFAQQMVPNSCATHALLSVLLNCPSLHLGSTLSRLKVHTSGMAPENKGWAIGNTPELAKAHNSHAMPQAKWRLDKSTGITTGRCTAEAFHFVSYVPIQGRLFELDGLKPFPIDHGPWGENEEWTEKFRRVIAERLGIASGEQYHDIRFNLMAVVPDKRLGLTHKLKMLKTNRQIVLEALQQLVKISESKVQVNVLPEDKKEADTNPLESKPKLTNMEPPSFELNNILHTENNNTKINLKESNLCSNPSDAAALEAHNYISKIQLVTKTSEALKTTNTDTSIVVKVETLLPPDYSTPLMIHTSPAPSGSSTDTSSEVGSAFNSPTQGWGWNSGQSSPASTKDFKKFVAIRIAGPDEEKVESPTAARLGKRFNDASTSGVKRVCLDGSNESTTQIPLWDHDKDATPCREIKDSTTSENNRITLFEGRDKFCSKYPELLEPHTFAPKDLLALLKNLESEITVCEINLHDENEKRKKYKMDDCRRTHNYDEFICTFLSMLAQQGKLADLVEQHLQRKPGIPIARVAPKKQEIKPNSSRRRRSRAKNRKRK